MAASENPIVELMKLKHSELKELCRELKLPVTGTKLLLATRIKVFYDQESNFPSNTFRTANKPPVDQVQQTINTLEEQISILEQKIQVSNLEQELSTLYKKYYTNQRLTSTPVSQPLTSVNTSKNIAATVHEPFVTYSRPLKGPHALHCDSTPTNTTAGPSSNMQATANPIPPCRNSDTLPNCIDSNPLLAYTIQATRMPTPEPHIFTGNILKYNDWDKSFKRFIDSNPTFTNSDKLFYLAKYTGGEVSDIVSGYYALDDDSAYDIIRGVIHKRYGHPYKVSQAFQKRLNEWPKIPTNDSAALQRFSDFLINCQTAMKTIPNLSFLNHAQENSKLKQLLPTWLRRKWDATAIRYCNENMDEFPPFNIFVEFVENYSELLNHPIATESDSKPHQYSGQTRGPVSTSHVVHNAHLKISGVNGEPRSPVSCALCQGNHKLYKCDQFKSLNHLQRNSFVTENKLCTNCLNEHHSGKLCPFHLTCRLCGKRSGHNSLLHDALVGVPSIDNEAPLEVKSTKSCLASTTNAAPGAASSLSCHTTKSNTSMIVPVYVSHKLRPDEEILTYAMLDSQSQLTFVTDELAQQLTSPDQNTKINLSTMTSTSESVSCNKYFNLVVRGYNHAEKLDLKQCFGCSVIPNNLQIPSTYDLLQWPHLAKVADKFPPLLDCTVGLLIGHDHHYASFPLDKTPQSLNHTNDPYAIRTPLGWTMIGPISANVQVHNSVVDDNRNVLLSMEVPFSLSVKSECSNVSPHIYQVVHKSQNSRSSATAVPMDVVKQLEQGFDMPGDREHSVSSIDDTEFLEILEKGIKQQSDGFYSMPLPFRGSKPPVFPNNKPQAVSRLKSLERKLKDPTFREGYNTFMSDMIESGDAEPVPDNQLNVENKWYLPHHNVINPKKPNKVRVVFDASCVFKGYSLNQSLLSGPDLNNTLIGVLTRFREREVAIACDIQKMFYRFKVDEIHRDFLRFLWYDQYGNIKEYRMTKHIFGAASSPGCSKFALLQMAKDHSKDRDLARWFIENCFYVDDGLYSCDTIQEAIDLLSDTSAVCASGNLKLHKLLSNRSEVLSAFPQSDLACDMNQFMHGDIDSGRALGIDWNPSLDIFSFTSIQQTQDLTRRAMLKLIASLFDPLGLIAPVVLLGKRLLQRVCHGLDWDEPLPADIFGQWKNWSAELKRLNKIQIPRCLKPPNISSKIIYTEVHTYADASEKGYGTCCYLRLFGQEGEVSSSLLFAKSRVVPLKGCTIPRLELQAAVLAAKVGTQLSGALSLPVNAQYYWSDSEIVLAYIQNTRKQLKQYVLNRVTTIRELTDVNSWNHVNSLDNPADIASRGCTVDHLLSSMWFQGPSFLQSSVDMSQFSKTLYEIPDCDIEIGNRPQLVSHCLNMDKSVLLEASDRLHSWTSAVKLSSLLIHSAQTRWKTPWKPRVNDLQLAEFYLIEQIQLLHFKPELDALKQGKPIPVSSSLLRLDPFLDKDTGVLRVGGRMKFAELNESERHPVIIPKNTHIANLIIRHYHDLSAHQGRGITTSYIRSAGYWIVNLTSAVSSYIYNCVNCRKLRRTTEVQKMSDLPSQRVNPSPPFSYIGLDCFGPFDVKDGRRYTKKYGVIFSCFYSRAVHVEVCDDMSSDSFINCLRSFVALRGPVREIHCDRGTNFVGTANELARSFMSMDNQPLKQYMENNRCEFIFNSPSASHMGGVWERQIRTFRNILNGISLQSKGLDSSSIRTVFYECMNIMNSRPLTTVDSDGLDPLTPNHLIQMKTSLVLPPPPCTFDSSEQYSRKRWKRVQAMIQLFWTRWKSHYLASLQKRNSWVKTRKFCVGDIVLLKDENLFRGQWKMCRITELINSQDGLVRRVKLLVGDSSPGHSIKHTTLERPVHKLVLLLPQTPPLVDLGSSGGV